MKPFAEELRGGDPDRSGEFPTSFVSSGDSRIDSTNSSGGLLADDPVVRMRAADAIEKISATRPECLAPYRTFFLSEVALGKQSGVRWHIAQILPRIARSRRDATKIEAILHEYLEDSSSIVKTNAMQALVELAERGLLSRTRVAALIREFSHTGTPAMRARGKRLLRTLTAELENATYGEAERS